MTTRKFTSEFGLHMIATYLLLVQQDDLERRSAQVELARNSFHIYIICKRPRITIDPSNFEATPEWIRGVLKVQRAYTFEEVPFVARNQTGHASLVLESPYPHNRFALAAPNGDQIVEGKVGILAHMLRIPHDVLNLEVLYVGQAYGKEGSRTAPDRLRNHSTLQGIYATASANFPDQEIWLVLCKFEEMLIASVDGTQQAYRATDEEDTAHVQRILRTPVSEQQRINFTEAALIRYFDAPYNKIYRDSFPNPAHGTYAECYEIDYNAVSVELTTDELNCRLYSAKVEPAWWHIPKFALHSREDRMSMFTFFGHDV